MSSYSPPSDLVPTATTTTAAPTTHSLTAQFGQLRNYHDGITLTVAPPTPYTPSASAAGTQPGDSYLEFAITITNNTSAPWDPSLCRADAQASGSEGQQVYDSAKGIGSSPSSMVLPGKSITWNVVFALPGTTDPQLQVTPGNQYEPSIFTS